MPNFFSKPYLGDWRFTKDNARIKLKQLFKLDRPREAISQTIASMRTEGDRVTNISTSLRTFSRMDTDTKTEFNLHDGIDSTILILKYHLKANEQRPAIEIMKKYGDIPERECYPGQYRSSVYELISQGDRAFKGIGLGMAIAR